MCFLYSYSFCQRTYTHNSILGFGIGISSELSPVVLKLVIEVGNESGRIRWWLIIALNDMRTIRYRNLECRCPRPYKFGDIQPSLFMTDGFVVRGCLE